MNDRLLIRMEKVSHTYGNGGHRVQALKEISLSIYRGEFMAISGPSGSGKSTLLHIAGCLLQPTSGSCWFEDRDLSNMKGDSLANIRNKFFGFIFQNFSLVPRFTALQNVALPLMYAGFPRRKRYARASELLIQVGLGNRMSHFPNAMSGGEQQRVAIARALVNNPHVLFADEPTGNLDTRTGGTIMDIIERSVSEGMTVVMVTHEKHAAKRASRTIDLLDSRIV